MESLKRLAAGRRPSIKDPYGLSLPPGGAHHRAFVGPPEDYDLIGANQFSLLVACGLREDHSLLDVGCGSLRGGRLFIPYLRPERYFGLEPNKWLVEAGINHEVGRDVVRLKRPRFLFRSDFDASSFGESFDFMLAQSIFSHTYADLALSGLTRLKTVLKPSGKIFATFIHAPELSDATGGSGWAYPECVSFEKSRFQDVVRSAGLVEHALDWWHPRQTWYLLTLPQAAGEASKLAAELRRPRVDHI